MAEVRIVKVTDILRDITEYIIHDSDKLSEVLADIASNFEVDNKELVTRYKNNDLTISWAVMGWYHEKKSKGVASFYDETLSYKNKAELFELIRDRS